jgi:acylpyruvate hydrolase
MRLLSLEDSAGRPFIGVRRGDGIVDLNRALPSFGPEVRDVGALLRSPDFDPSAIAAAVAKASAVLDGAKVVHRSLHAAAGKVLCLGLNYVDHAAESKNATPSWPVVFGRFGTSFVGHGRALVAPSVSTAFDYEAELVVVIGKSGRHIPKERALDHVFGYTLMNDGSIRDYQVKTPQWTIGKNFDASGAIGPEVVTADELPAGARGLLLQGRLNGDVMQRASTAEMIFDVPTTIALLSEALTLEAGDLIAMGTPSGVGFVRSPPVFLRPGDVFEVEVERLGILRNRVVAEGDPARSG